MTEVEFFFNTRLGSPESWVFFAIAILFSGFMGITLWRRKRAIELMIHERNEPLLLHDLGRRQRWSSLIVMIVAMLCISFSLLNPKWGFHWEEIQRKGVDVMVAVDVSQSMLAKDSEPNRLINAKRKILDLLNLIEGDRIGLIAFAGTSYLQCPLTLDYGAFRIFLDLLDTDLIPQQGTAIDQAIFMAMNAFRQSGQKSRALILITDGEEHSGEYLEAAKQASEMGIRIYTLGFGSPDGHPIPSQDGRGNLRDSQGNIVISRLNEEILQQIALETGGAYVRAQTGDRDLRQIYEGEILKKLEAQDLKSSRQRRYEPRFQWFLLFGFLLILIDTLIRHLPRHRIPNTGRLLILAILILPSTSQANVLDYFGFSSEQEKRIKEGRSAYQSKDYLRATQMFQQAELDSPGDSKSKYNQANSMYKSGDFQGAKELFQELVNAPDEAIATSSAYNLGNSFYRLGQLEQSIQFYEKTLERSADHHKAKKNLEFVRQKLREMAEKNRQNKNQQNKENKNNQKGQNKNQKDKSDNSQGDGKQQNPDKKTQPESSEQDKQQSKQNQGNEASENSQKDTKNANQKENKENQQESQSSKQVSENKSKKSEKAEEGETSKQKASTAGLKQGRLTKEEAQRFLNRLNKNHKQQMKDFIRYKLGNQSTTGSKEW